jgi:hypothetical protein
VSCSWSGSRVTEGGSAGDVATVECRVAGVCVSAVAECFGIAGECVVAESLAVRLWD